MAGSQRFTNKAVFITGAASGIGRAAAIAFASEGARVAILDRSADALKEVEATARKTGGEVLAITGDVSKPEDIEAAVAQVIETSTGWISLSTMPVSRTRLLPYTRSSCPNGTG